MLTKQTVKSMVSLATVSCFLLLTQACVTTAEKSVPPGVPPAKTKFIVYLNQQLELIDVEGFDGAVLSRGGGCKFCPPGLGPVKCKEKIDNGKNFCRGLAGAAIEEAGTLIILNSKTNPACWFFYKSGGGLVGWPSGCS